MLAFLISLLAVATPHCIDDYGAIPGDSSINQAWKNSQALTSALKAANSSVTDRIVTVPQGEYWMMPIASDGLDTVTLWIDGEIVFPDDQSQFPAPDEKHYDNLLQFTNCNNLVFTGTGSGAIEGQGYWWWVNEFLGRNKYQRPHMLYIEVCQHILFEKIALRNSPRFHFKLVDIDQLQVRQMEIFADWWGTRSDGKYNWRLPIFPLNTDGIDPAGSNIHIHDVKIQNYDDAVVAKPSNQKRSIATCTENMLVERVKVTYGVGMSIGSVPPNDYVNCVRNVTFRQIDFSTPFKAIYIKTNPGDSGSGIIENVLYEDIYIDTPIWWGTYIGPQQQEQPDGTGPGCMFYPLIKDCPTQPRVPIRDVTLRNVHTRNAILSPGILRCNETNPCSGFQFNNVTVSGWLHSEGYIVENVEGAETDSDPIPAFSP